MDNFYESLPFAQKMRVHFHRFMRRVHRELTDLEGEKNPLDKVADRIASEARVICFDEFFVSDITDAMILGTLLPALFNRGVCLVATSNIVPDGLYRDGLQRARFLPAIDMLNKYTKVVNVDGGWTTVCARLSRRSCITRRSVLQLMLACAPVLKVWCQTQAIRADVDVEIEGRMLRAAFEGDDVVWFDFLELCDGPRSQNDYIQLAHEYHTVLVANVPQLGRDSDDQARRFINLIDEFYDRNVKLVISAARPLQELYSGGKLSFEFERTTSRLLEMQSREYLAQPHKP